jgi:hypothetical protein
MKKFFRAILIISFTLFSTNVCANESDRIKADAAAAGSYHASAVSMAFWGLLIIAGIAVAVVLIESSSAHSE